MTPSSPSRPHATAVGESADAGETSSASGPQVVLDNPGPKIPAVETTWMLLKTLLILAMPVLVEQMLAMIVGLTDTFVANRIPGTEDHRNSAGAAVGTIAYITWFIGLIVSLIATGATAMISRAKGAKHKSLQHAVVGQTVAVAAAVGLAGAVAVFLLAPEITSLTGLAPDAAEMALQFIRVIAFGLPAMVVLMASNACLRGVGDTVSPMIAMIVVDTINVALCLALTFGFDFGPVHIPSMGFIGIAYATVAAYIAGAVVQSVILLAGFGGVRLHRHRLRPDLPILKRLLRIGLPAGVEGILVWVAQFTIVIIINGLNGQATSGAAHNIAIRVEAISYLMGMAFAVAASTLVGQSLGMKSPQRARRCANLAYGVGAAIMTAAGVGMILFSGPVAAIVSKSPEVIDLVAKTLFVAGFSQFGFAAAMIYSGALRGAGDTLSVMAINLFSVIGVRLVGVLIVTQLFGGGLVAIWIVLCSELCLRDALMFLRFRFGGWATVKV